MSIDSLHDRIRKRKNPIVADFCPDLACVPPALAEEAGGEFAGYVLFCRRLLELLSGAACGARFSLGFFSLFGEQGIAALQSLLRDARRLGYYVFLDAPEISSAAAAAACAERIFGAGEYPCDALVLSAFIGSDAIRPFLPYCKEKKGNVFVTIRSANKSAAEVQDLLSGTRHVHDAIAETVDRLGEGMYGKCGYSELGGVVSAGAPAYLRSLRTKRNRIFFLVDGLDTPSGNGKNCSLAFDRFGYGAAVCTASPLTAWRESEADCLTAAREAAERAKRIVTNYFTIL
ncbi:MAG: hypothetical protein LUH51_01610 [Firmicutes bacterium]|nr:hypothetical protein [Bacillota bacterium]